MFKSSFNGFRAARVLTALDIRRRVHFTATGFFAGKDSGFLEGFRLLSGKPSSFFLILIFDVFIKYGEEFLYSGIM